ncbi:ABC transporter permease [Algoriphagus mannitolivorans]|uniref:ABC transporter permease n=1 Tax=Algoriphagus mannitolivorans TaxID=226504 RepID=UPI000421CFD4|nr:ABC transporter permease [Algoriphagus mannitolivorans]
MLKNYFKIAVRNLFKHKLHTGINLIGLSLGLGVSILIFFFVQFEMSFDSFHQDLDRIYRVKSFERIDGVIRETYSSPVIVEAAFREEFPQIEAISGVTGADVQAILPDESTQNQRIRLVNPDFLKILTFPLVKGDISTQLQDKFSIVVTEDVAARYFGDENPIGQSIQLKMGEDFMDYQVTGVLKNLPANNSIPFEILMPIENMDFFSDKESLASWYNVWGFNLVKLYSPEQVESIHQSMEAFMKKSLGEDYEEGGLYFRLTPVEGIHFSEGAGNGGIETTKKSLLWILSGIASLVLLIACINFTTMAIGRATTRAKEVGVRKTMGASFSQLINQFLMEAFLTTLMASILGLILAELLLPTFNELFQKELDILYGPVQFGILTGLILLISTMAGAYPAFFLSGLRPIKVLKGNLSIHFGKQGLRKGLVAFQFFISFLLIASTLIMVNQMSEIRNYDLGFVQDQVVIVDMPDYPSTSFVTSLKESFRTAETFRQTLSSRTEIASTALTVATYGDDAFWQVAFPLEDGTMFSFKVNFVSGDYMKTLGMELVEGRELSPLVGADSSALLINEAFAKAFNWEDPTGELLPRTDFEPHQIVGVVKDFHHASLYQPIEPVMIAKSPMAVFSGITNLMINSSTNPKLLIRSSVGDIQQLRGVIETEWNKMFAGMPLKISFLDETVEEQYQAEERLGKMVFIAASIAILIATMGLFAMVALSISGRTKEIGIRKVLGASSWSISWLFGKEFIITTLIGVAIALPLSIYLMQGWLDQFAVKGWPSWISFALLGVSGIGFTLMIVYAQSYRATQVNPVKTLKDE